MQQPLDSSLFVFITWWVDEALVFHLVWSNAYLVVVGRWSKALASSSEVRGQTSLNM